MYTALVLPKMVRDNLLDKFPPNYDTVVAHHITLEFGVTELSDSEPKVVRVVGYTNSGDGLEALVVTVDGKVRRCDGKIYHITWSLDNEKYKPKDSNTLLQNKPWTIILPIDLGILTPTIQC